MKEAEFRLTFNVFAKSAEGAHQAVLDRLNRGGEADTVEILNILNNRNPHNAE